MSASAINAVISSLIGAANGIAFVALLAALVIPFYYRRGAITGSSLTLLICTQLTYFFIATLNLGESSGMGKANPALISTLYLVGAILFVFFFYAQDRNVTIAQLREGINGHQSAASALSAQSELLLSYLNTLPDPVLAVNAGNAIAFSNNAFMKAFLPEQQWESGASLKVNDLPTSAQSLIARCSFQEVAALGEPVTRPLSLPSMGRSGQVFHVSAFPLKDKDGQASLVLYNLRDITQEMRMIETLARERNAQPLSALVSVAMPEFSNILASISGIAQQLAGDESASQGFRKHAHQAIELVERGDALLKELSHAASLAGESDVIDLGELLEERKGSLEEALPDGIKLRLVNSEAGMVVKGDADDLLASIINLVANAGEASLPGGTVAVVAGWSEANKANAVGLTPGIAPGMVKVSVADSGRGISPEDRERVFDPFFTTKAGHRGMGLPMALSIATRHCGSLHLERSDELGTEFALYLPPAKR